MPSIKRLTLIYLPVVAIEFAFVLIFLMVFIIHLIETDETPVFLKLMYIAYNLVAGIKVILGSLTYASLFHWDSLRSKDLINSNSHLSSLTLAIFFVSMLYMIVKTINVVVYIIVAIGIGIINVIEFIISPYEKEDV